MSDTQDQSHLTVEDAGTTTDPADLTNSGVGHTAFRDEDPVESADEVARATDGGPAVGGGSTETGTAPADAEPTATTTAMTDTASSAPARADETDDRTARSDDDGAAAGRADSAGTPSVDEVGSSAAPATTSGLSSLIADDDIGHVFDQTNGVIDGLEGDSDGTADSDLRSSAERADEDPAFEAHEETEAPSDPDTDDTRRTGN